MGPLKPNATRRAAHTLHFSWYGYVAGFKRSEHIACHIHVQDASRLAFNRSLKHIPSECLAVVLLAFRWFIPSPKSFDDGYSVAVIVMLLIGLFASSARASDVSKRNLKAVVGLLSIASCRAIKSHVFYGGFGFGIYCEHSGVFALALHERQLRELLKGKRSGKNSRATQVRSPQGRYRE